MEILACPVCKGELELTVVMQVIFHLIQRQQYQVIIQVILQ